MKKINIFSTDELMLQLQHHLNTDLMSHIPKSLQAKISTMDIKAFRKSEWFEYQQAPTDDFKKIYQCQNFLKRYIFEDDLFSQDYLRAKAKEDFLIDQENFGLPKDIPRSAEIMLDRARSISTKVLGQFDLVEFAELCKWGKRAAKGLPAKRAYLDVRSRSLTATSQQLPWYHFFCATDGLFRKSTKVPKVVDSVNYTTVPKSFKAVRGIAPDASFGGFLSQGLGTLIRNRLEESTPIRLSTAQDVHKKLAKQGSINGRLSTIDMSKASDSFTWDHIVRLVPESWLEVMQVVRVPNIEIDGVKRPLKSYMLMGSGHTFPLQTLLFYSLAKAVAELTDSRGPVRVFGDDIILPTKCVGTLMTILEWVGFTINREKSFYDGTFRESCGGDYYNGVDVRPAMPEGINVKGSSRKYAALGFKVANALLKRWSYHEIPSTIGFLYSALTTACPSGIPLGTPGVHAEDSCLLYDMGPYPLVKPVMTYKGWVPYITQRILVSKGSSRTPKSELPYLWQALRNAPDDFEFDKSLRPHPQSITPKFSKVLREARKGGVQQLVWKKTRRLFHSS